MLSNFQSLGADNGNERSKLPVIGSDNGTPVSGNNVISVGVDILFAGREFFITNDSNANLTFIVTCDGGTIGFLIQPGEQFDERLPLFTSISVTASGNWRWRVRGNAS